MNCVSIVYHLIYKLKNALCLIVSEPIRYNQKKERLDLPKSIKEKHTVTTYRNSIRTLLTTDYNFKPCQA